MPYPEEALKLLRRAAALADDKIDIGSTALALAALEKPSTDLAPYREHLDALTRQVRAAGPADRLAEQIDILRKILVTGHKYTGGKGSGETGRTGNLIDTIERKRGASVLLGILYLHTAHAAGWAMTGVDVSGLFLLRLSARDGQALIDPNRSGQTCLVEEAEGSFHDRGTSAYFPLEEEETAEEETLDLSSSLIRPLSRRDVLLRLQHGVKRRFLAQDRVEPAIATLQGMILFAPKHEALWREIGYLQAERGHIRAAISALEVVQNLAVDPLPAHQSDAFLRDLRLRLN